MNEDEKHKNWEIHKQIMSIKKDLREKFDAFLKDNLGKKDLNPYHNFTRHLSLCDGEVYNLRKEAGEIK